MTKDEAIEKACSIMGLAYHTIGDYAVASDGFCRKCPASRYPDDPSSWTFRNEGQILDYIESAVQRQLIADGYKIWEKS